MGVITVEQMRLHWLKDRGGAYCKRVQAWRDEAWDIYERMRYQPGRRRRGRLLSRLNHALCLARFSCTYCTQDVLWPDGFIGHSRYSGLVPRHVLRGMARG